MDRKEGSGPSPRRPGRNRPVGWGLRAGRYVAAIGALSLVAAGCTRPTSSSSTVRVVPVPKGPGLTVVGQPAPVPGASVSDITCPTAATCFAAGAIEPSGSTAGFTGAVYATGNAGKTWQIAATPLTAPGSLTAISCPTSSSCMAVGNTATTTQLAGAAATTTDGGRTWQVVAAPAGSTTLDDVHCSSAGPLQCIAIALVGSTVASDTTTDGGTTWTSGGTIPSGFAGPGTMSCPLPGTCLVAGYVPTTPGQGTGAVATTTDDGKTWTLAALPKGTGILHSISCTGPSSCAAVGTTSTATSGIVPAKSAVVVTDDGGATFQAATAPAGVGDAFGISCPAVATCAVVGTRWSSSTPPTPLAGVATTTPGTSTTATSTSTTGATPTSASTAAAATSTSTTGTTSTTVAPPGATSPAPPAPTSTPASSGSTPPTSGSSSVPSSPTTVPAGGAGGAGPALGPWTSPPVRYVPVGLTALDCPATRLCIAAGSGVFARMALVVPTSVPSEPSSPASGG